MRLAFVQATVVTLRCSLRYCLRETYRYRLLKLQEGEKGNSQQGRQRESGR